MPNTQTTHAPGQSRHAVQSDRRVSRGSQGKMKAEVALRDRRLLDMWAQRRTLTEIAQAEGYTDQRSAWRAVHRAIKRMPPTEDIEVRRQRDLRMFDQLLTVANMAARQTNFVVSEKGEVVFGPADNQGVRRPLIDLAPNLRAIDTVVRVNARMAALSGEDLPQRIRVEYVDPEDFDQWIKAEDQEAAAVEQRLAALRAEGKVVDLPMLPAASGEG